MKMKNLLFGVILGLFAVVHSTPVNSVTQIPAKAEDAVDEFEAEHFILYSLTTEPPKRTTTIQASTKSEIVQDRSDNNAIKTLNSADTDKFALDSSNTESSQLNLDNEGFASGDSDPESEVKSEVKSENYGNPLKPFIDFFQDFVKVVLPNTGDHNATTILNPAVAVLTTKTDNSMLDSSTTQSPLSDSFSTPDVKYDSLTTQSSTERSGDEVTTDQSNNAGSGEGSGMEDNFDQSNNAGSGEGSGMEDMFDQSSNTSSSMHSSVQTSHQTPSNTEEYTTQTPSYDMTESDAVRETTEKSTHSALFPHEGDHHAATTLSSTVAFAMSTRNNDDTTSPTTQSPQSDFTSSSMQNVDHDFLNNESGHEEIPTTSPSMTTQSIETTSTSLFEENAASGSESEEGSNTQMSTVSPTTVNNEESGSGSGSESGSGSGLGPETSKDTSLEREIKARVLFPVQSEAKESHAAEVSDKPDSEMHKGHSTPDWIIILGFVVGVAALVMLLAAIATRDKWNGPKRQKTKTESTDQQREVEMETFLQNDMPKENGKATEYTVIPLEELSEKYSH